MKFAEVKKGRVFVLRLHNGEIIHEEIEKFAFKNHVTAAKVIAIGGADKGSILIVGPEDGRAEIILPMEYVLDNVYEITGNGTIFPNAYGKPILHMHISCGRKNSSITGCVRKGVKVWHVMEVIIEEFTGCKARRIIEKESGFELLQP